MRIATIEKNGRSEPVVISDSRALSLTPLGFSDVLAFIAAGERGKELANRRLADCEPLSVDGIRLLAPIPRPPKILCVGLNYRDHAIESKMEIPATPTIFPKLSSSVIGPDQEIVVPACTAKPDYEAEFAVIIGRTGKRIPQSQWRDYVYGYTILNDVSARDLQFQTSQWSLAKSVDTFCPIGPHIVTADEVSDPHNLSISLSIGCEVLQHSNTRELIFGIAELIEFISRVLTLEAGDVISTGTPSGVGLGRNPPRWLRDGDEVVVKIDQIGTLRNRVIMEPSVPR